MMTEEDDSILVWKYEENVNRSEKNCGNCYHRNRTHEDGNVYKYFCVFSNADYDEKDHQVCDNWHPREDVIYEELQTLKKRLEGRETVECCDLHYWKSDNGIWYDENILPYKYCRLCGWELGTIRDPEEMLEDMEKRIQKKIEEDLEGVK